MILEPWWAAYWSSASELAVNRGAPEGVGCGFGHGHGFYTGDGFGFGSFNNGDGDSYGEDYGWSDGRNAESYVGGELP